MFTEDVGEPLLPMNYRLTFKRRVHECQACINARAMSQVDAIAAQFANVTPREPAYTNVVPAYNTRIVQGRAIWAAGARKARLSNRGDAPTTSHAAQSARVIFANGAHHATRALAARGW